MPPTDVKILLSHDPTHWDFEVNKNHLDINLMLIKDILMVSNSASRYPVGSNGSSQFVYKQWAGLYQKGAQYLYVNRGFGFLGYAGRVGILPEITTLILTGKK